MTTRRAFLLGAGALAAPAIIRIPGLLMPGRSLVPLDELSEDALETIEIEIDPARSGYLGLRMRAALMPGIQKWWGERYSADNNLTWEAVLRA